MTPWSKRRVRRYSTIMALNIMTGLTVLARMIRRLRPGPRASH